MRRWLSSLVLLLVVATSLSGVVVAETRNEVAATRPAPPFTQTRADAWLNSAPLTWADLKGEVVLLDFWAFECWNCYRSIPWLHSLEQRFGGAGLKIVSIHTPELAAERVRDNVVKKVAEFRITNPVMLDDDYAYWNAIGNQVWPAFYLVDRNGRIRFSFYGETHEGDASAQRIEAALQRLLDEGGPAKAAG